MLNTIASIAQEKCKEVAFDKIAMIEQEQLRLECNYILRDDCPRERFFQDMLMFKKIEV